MTGEQYPAAEASERGWPVQILLRRAEKAPRSRTQAMERRPPAVIGIECPAASREFRWNHGQVLFALSLSQAQGVFVPLGPIPPTGDYERRKNYVNSP